VSHPEIAAILIEFRRELAKFRATNSRKRNLIQELARRGL
jgi:hypothetical protein